MVTGIGAVEGRVQARSTGLTLRFTLNDSVYHCAVDRYLQLGEEERVRDAWDRRAIVEGTVTRDASTGRSTAIRETRGIVLLDASPPGAYGLARGAGFLSRP